MTPFPPTRCLRLLALLLAANALCGARVLAQTGGLLPAVSNFGPFDARQIPIELQAWWTPLPDDGKGFGHIHALCRWPEIGRAHV